MTRSPERCVHCGRDDNAVPLLAVHYHGRTFWICSQHLPVLIHDPQQLAGKLAGAERLPPADSDRHDAG
ncbi:MAG: hypothetical protein QN141_02780 [Armatimonadota bacterium]|nr:hypothetical protein [Armatimonadota bacterium]MDR7452581.1 hypothetical protein [Armatimonadota bacterium]MDR7468204.1 hypothetical protein [Armatimonadota bacterium]MDR7495064.1 hypothetical protein [Armatimonadota bacterium]MDR7500116.1 hypothetical protein [Armatimonadota bacterium]